MVNRYWLNKWAIVETNQCNICNEGIDNILHVYWNCRLTRLFWSRFKDWCEPKLGSIELNIETVFLGPDDLLLCCLILIGKRYIYGKCFKDEQPDFATFLVYVNRVRDTELYLAKVNNTVEEFMRKWGNIL